MLRKDQKRSSLPNLECCVMAHAWVVFLVSEPSVLDVLPELITVSRTNTLNKDIEVHKNKAFWLMKEVHK